MNQIINQASVWSPHLKGHKEVLEKVQWRAARYVLHEYGEGTRTTNMIHRLKWESLEQRRLKARVVMAYRIVHKLVKIPSNQFVPTASTTRGDDMRFHRIYNKTNYYKYGDQTLERPPIFGGIGTYPWGFQGEAGWCPPEAPIIKQSPL